MGSGWRSSAAYHRMRCVTAEGAEAEDARAPIGVETGTGTEIRAAATEEVPRAAKLLLQVHRVAILIRTPTLTQLITLEEVLILGTIHTAWATRLIRMEPTACPGIRRQRTVRILVMPMELTVHMVLVPTGPLLTGPTAPMLLMGSPGNRQGPIMELHRHRAPCPPQLVAHPRQPPYHLHHRHQMQGLQGTAAAVLRPTERSQWHIYFAFYIT
mmetsp:Transcript_78270/g.135811  ORF Transcript_78270/g.135811 Transcript_78270/m.135811 type:complete len:213 (-) Transcript_78270:8-646(-)